MRTCEEQESGEYTMIELNAYLAVTSERAYCMSIVLRPMLYTASFLETDTREIGTQRAVCQILRCVP